MYHRNAARMLPGPGAIAATRRRTSVPTTLPRCVDQSREILGVSIARGSQLAARNKSLSSVMSDHLQHGKPERAVGVETADDGFYS
jgi:hypothetical protein